MYVPTYEYVNVLKFKIWIAVLGGGWCAAGGGDSIKYYLLNLDTNLSYWRGSIENMLAEIFRLSLSSYNARQKLSVFQIANRTQYISPWSTSRKKSSPRINSGKEPPMYMYMFRILSETDLRPNSRKKGIPDVKLSKEPPLYQNSGKSSGFQVRSL